MFAGNWLNLFTTMSKWKHYLKANPLFEVILRSPKILWKESWKKRVIPSLSRIERITHCCTVNAFLIFVEAKVWTGSRHRKLDSLVPKFWFFQSSSDRSSRYLKKLFLNIKLSVECAHTHWYKDESLCLCLSHFEDIRNLFVGKNFFFFLENFHSLYLGIFFFHYTIIFS